MSANDHRLLSIDTQGIAEFLDSMQGRSGHKSSNRTQRSYLAEINRVMAFMQSIGLRADNPAQELWSQLKVTTPMKARSIMFMHSQVISGYVHLLRETDPGAEGISQTMGHAIACLIIEMGFTVKEVQKLVLRDVVLIDVDGQKTYRVTAPGHRTLQPRTGQLSEEGYKWMHAWLTQREQLRVISPAKYKQFSSMASRLHSKPLIEHVGGNRLPDHLAKCFVTLAGRSNFLDAGLRLNKIAINRIREGVVYLAAKQVFLSAGISAGAFMSPQTLRNAFGAELLNSGVSEQDAAYRMGLMTLDQIWALKRTAMVAAPI